MMRFKVKMQSPRKLQIFGAAALLGALLASGCGKVSATQASLASSTIGNAPTTSTRALGGSTAPLGKVTLQAGTTGALHGQVVDANQHPIAGVVIQIKETGQRLPATDANGNFAVQGIAAGNYTFTAMATGYVQASPSGVAVQGGQTAAVPAITMTPGVGASGITNITYTQSGIFGNVNQAKAQLLAPLGVAVRGSDVMVLDANHSALVHTGVIRQYGGDDGSFVGAFGDYTWFLGRHIMTDTVEAIALDNQSRTWVLDSGKLWCFDANGDKQSDPSIDGSPTAFAIDQSVGTMYVNGDGVTKLDGEGGSPQKLANAGDATALAAYKGVVWAIVNNKVQKLGADGASTLEFGAGGSTTADEFQKATALAVDPRNGNVAVVDSGSKNVYVYDATGARIGKIGQGVFQNPTAITIDAAGKAYVVDATTKKVYKFVPTATI